MRRLLDLGKRGYCRSIESGAIGCELRSVTRAIPALLQRIPVHDAAEMRAAGGMQMQLSYLVPACSDLLQSATHQATLPRPQPLDGSDFVHRKVLREIFQRRDVLADVLTAVLVDLTCRRIDILPCTGADRDQVRDQDAGDEAVSDALSGIATDDEACSSSGDRPMKPTKSTGSSTCPDQRWVIAPMSGKRSRAQCSSAAKRSSPSSASPALWSSPPMITRTSSVESGCRRT